ncbi:DDE-type integrase/transposase/recombinase [Salipiger aestuarii]|uniref:DDE-type integrase/transposase/recombinase n=1 Tax=Salipiger aestuarii TaxID=568098 RepID=UPI0035CBDEB7
MCALLVERAVILDAATVYRWVQKFGPEIRKRANGRHRGWRGLQWHVDRRWCHLWRAIDQWGQRVDFRLTERRTANAARAFMRQGSETVGA